MLVVLVTYSAVFPFSRAYYIEDMSENIYVLNIYVYIYHVHMCGGQQWRMLFSVNSFGCEQLEDVGIGKQNVLFDEFSQGKCFTELKNCF